MDYKKFADLHTYLFNEVNKAWHRRGYLTAGEFFCIIIWKSNRSKGKMKKKLQRLGDLGKVSKEITSRIYKAHTDKERLTILIDEYGFRLPIASAIAAVHSPDVFVLYDFRGRESLGIEDFGGRKDEIERYFSEYLAKAKHAVKGNAREQDAWIWGKSFYVGLRNFLKE
jgi:hypothetical protein